MSAIQALVSPVLAADQNSERPATGSASTSPTGFETVPPGEAEKIGEIISLTTQLLQMRYPGSMARRGVHPKDHGCVKATFKINSDIPEKYRVGVFATPGAAYNAWIRFSNATPVLGPDIDKNGPASRGMAIKLMGVEGDKLLGDPTAKTQDFLLINLPGFAFPNVAEYLAVTRIQLANHDDITTFFTPPLSPDRIKTALVVQRIAQTKLGNPLDGRYFSASPFLFGKDRVAKFSAAPRNPENTPVPENPSANYLREAMEKELSMCLLAIRQYSISRCSCVPTTPSRSKTPPRNGRRLSLRFRMSPRSQSTNKISTIRFRLPSANTWRSRHGTA